MTALIIFCFVSCQESKTNLEVMQEEDRLVNILVDMYVAESALNKQSIVVRDSLTAAYRDNIMLIHDLTEEEFDTLFWTIQTDVDHYGDIHKKVLTKLKDMSKGTDKK